MHEHLTSEQILFSQIVIEWKMMNRMERTKNGGLNEDKQHK